MSELEKTLLTDTVSLLFELEKPKRFMIPKEKAKGLFKLLSEYEVASDTDLVSVESVFPELSDPVKKSATILRGARGKEGLSQVQLAEKLGITQGDLSKMERGKRPIGKKMAMKLSEVLNIDYRVFL